MSASSRARPSDQALAVPVEPVSRLAPSGFDPSRDGKFISLSEALYAWAGQVDEAVIDCDEKQRSSGLAAHITMPATSGVKLSQLLRNAASAIEARRAETQGGSVADESAVAESETPSPNPETPHVR